LSIHLTNHELKKFKPLLTRIEDEEINKLIGISQNG
jgi:hypothetical protein